jgi:hypothetical protein
MWFKMTKKALEPRTTMKVPVSFRELVRRKAKEKDRTMMDFLVETIEAGAGRQAQTPTTTPTGGQYET